MTSVVPRNPLLPLALIGAGKQSEHALNLMQSLGHRTDKIVLFDDAYPKKKEGSLGNPVRGSIRQGLEWIIENRAPAMIMIGSRFAGFRYVLFRRLAEAGIIMPSLVHASSVVAAKASIGPNSLVMAGCVVSSGVRMGACAMLSPGVTIDHDCIIGDNVMFGTGATLAGAVKVGSHVFIGAGATLAPEVEIGERVLVGAGALSVKNIEAGMVAVGVPARAVREVKAGDDAPTEESLRPQPGLSEMAR